MATPNEKEDAEVYPVVILDPNGKRLHKGHRGMADGHCKAES